MSEKDHASGPTTPEEAEKKVGDNGVARIITHGELGAVTDSTLILFFSGVSGRY